MVSARVVSVTLQANVASFVAGMRTAQASVAQLTAATTAAAAQRQALTSLGTTAGKIGLVAAAGLGAAVVASARFDKAMSLVQSATRGSAADMEALRAAALKAGQDTAFSATEAAGGITALAKAGVSSKDILSGGLRGALDLAAAGELDVGQAAEIAATALNQFGLSGKDIPHVADLLAAAAGNAQGEVTDMAESLKYVGPIAAQMGVSIEETTGTIAELASQGILGSQAGTSLRGMLSSLTSPSKQAADEMKKLGINVYDAQGNFVGFEGVAGQLHKTMSDLSNADRDEALGRIFGNTQITAARILYAGGAKDVRDWTDRVNDSGAASEMAATKMDNLAGDLERLKGSLETALIGTGDSSQGPLRGLVQGLDDVVKAYNGLPDAAKSSVAGMLAATAVLGTGAFLGAKVITGIATTRQALIDLGVTATQTRTLLAGMGKGIAFGAIVIGLGQIDKAFDNLSHNDLDGSELERSLKALSQGRVEGTVFDVLGADLDRFSKSLSLAGGGLLNNANQFLDKFIPGDDEVTEAKRRIDMIDEALAAMVESGNKGEASAIFDQLVAAAVRGGHSVDEVRAAFDQYGIALDNAGAANRVYESDIIASAGANREQAGAAHAAAAAIKEQTDAMRDARSEAIRAANAEINYQASLDDAQQAIQDNGKTLDITTEKGRANKTALLQMADAWNNQSRAAKNARGSHFRAIEAFVKTAVAMGDNEEHARRYAKRLYEIPTRRDTKVDADTKGADDKLDTTKGKLNDLGKTTATATVRAEASQALSAIYAVVGALSRVHDTSATVTVNHREIYTSAPQSHASGGYITGPGTATSDSIPAYLSHGEYVVRAAAVDKYGVNFFHRANAMRLAGGGPVGRSQGEKDRDDRQHHRNVERHLQETRKQLEKHREHLEKIRQNTKDLQDTVAGNFRTDTFGQNFTLQGAMTSLRQDTRNADRFRHAARNAKQLGLDGGVFRSLLESGNTEVLNDIDSRRDVRRLEAAWRQRNKATANLTFGALSGPGEPKTLEGLSREIHQLNHQLKHLGKHVHEGARQGTREGTDRHQRHRQATTRKAAAP